jgi:hypothetical protein
MGQKQKGCYPAKNFDTFQTFMPDYLLKTQESGTIQTTPKQGGMLVGTHIIVPFCPCFLISNEAISIRVLRIDWWWKHIGLQFRDQGRGFGLVIRTPIQNPARLAGLSLFIFCIHVYFTYLYPPSSWDKHKASGTKLILLFGS